MIPTLLYRTALASGLILLGWIAYRLVSRTILSRVQASARQSGLFSKGIPAILYFTTPDCAICKSMQRPALQRLQDKMGDCLQVVEIDAYERPELAREWKVLSVPTTFIIDANGNPRQVNYGATPAEKLLEQLNKVESIQ